MGARRFRVFVVDDHEVVRSGIVALLEREPDIEVLGAVGSGEEALLFCRAVRPDVVVLDQRLPGMSGVDTCRELITHHKDLAVLILTSFLSDEIIHAAMVAGARGYLTKEGVTDELARAVRSVAQGGAVLGSEVARRLIEWTRHPKFVRPGDRVLTPREVQILSLVSRGLSNRAIAKQLCLSEPSVKMHLRSMMKKLGASRRSDAVAAGIERGVI